MTEPKIIIAGGRNYSDYQTIKEELNKILKKYRYYDCDQIDAEVVGGGASGADTLGEQAAKELSLPVKVFMADWKTYGRSAGPIRNKQMADYVAGSDCIGVLLCFWDGKSRGTANMIKTAQSKNIETHIVYY